jgi:hypothetical protein
MKESSTPPASNSGSTSLGATERSTLTFGCTVGGVDLDQLDGQPLAQAR